VRTVAPGCTCRQLSPDRHSGYRLTRVRGFLQAHAGILPSSDRLQPHTSQLVPFPLRNREVLGRATLTQVGRDLFQSLQLRYYVL
jgi:hypothetical protein